MCETVTVILVYILFLDSWLVSPVCYTQNVTWFSVTRAWRVLGLRLGQMASRYGGWLL